MTPDEMLLEEVRDYIGSEPDDAAVWLVLDRFAGQSFRAERAARSILQRRLSDVTSDTSSFAVAGDYSESSNTTAASARLAALLRRLDAIIGDAVSDLPVVTAVDLLSGAEECAPGRRRR